jgi:hypothetical protein
MRAWRILAVLAMSMSTAFASELPTGVTMITLERSPCFGTCPEYSVRATRSGTVRFDGKSWVRALGRHDGAVSADSFRRLAAAIDTAEFDRLPETFPNDVCEQFFTDHPTMWVTVVKESKPKRVSYYFGCRGGRFADDIARIVKLGEAIDEVLETARWIGPESERQPGRLDYKGRERNAAK